MLSIDKADWHKMNVFLIENSPKFEAALQPKTKKLK